MCDWEFRPSKFVWDALEREGVLPPEDNIIKIEPIKLYRLLLELDIFTSEISLTLEGLHQKMTEKIDSLKQKMTEKLDSLDQKIEVFKEEQETLQNWHMVNCEE